MDHYTREAYEIAIGTIQENIARLEKYGKQGSGDVHNVKNWRRFGAAFAWDPEVYTSILENPDVSPEKLMKGLRKTESRLMKQWEVISKVPMHHKYALRSAGDLPIDLPPEIMEEVREILHNEYGIKGGNGKLNLNATNQFNELIHRNRPGANNSAFDFPHEIPEDLKEEYLHRKGQDLTPDLRYLLNENPKTIAEALANKVQIQNDRFIQASNNPRVIAERTTFDEGSSQLVTDKSGKPISGFSVDTTPEEVEILNATGKAAIDQNGRSLASNSARAFVEGKPEGSIYKLNPGREAKKLIQLIKDSPNGLRLNTQFYAGGLGAIAGVALDPEAIDKAVKGDYTGAAGAAVKGEAISQGIQRVGIPAVKAIAKPIIQKMGPTVVNGIMRLAPIASVLGPISVGATIGDLMNTYLPKTTHTSGRGSGRAAFKN